MQLSKLRRKQIDKLEQEILKHDQVYCPTEDLFTKGLYTRTCFIPKGTFLTSEIHKTEHPFVILQGKINVYDVASNETIYCEAPYMGVTIPGTRRVLYAFEDTIWATFHVTELTDVEAIGKEILVQRGNVIPQYLNKKLIK